jgi:hypothetical protein
MNLEEEWTSMKKLTSISQQDIAYMQFWIGLTDEASCLKAGFPGSYLRG